MIYRVEHKTEFVYSAPVFLEPHTFRLRPRSDGAQRLRAFNIRITPEPAGVTEVVEVDGTPSIRAWFNGLLDRLVVETRCEVETLRTNPWDYLVDAESRLLPLRYPEPLAQHLLPYRIPSANSEPVARLAEHVAGQAGGETVPFLSLLCQAIYQECECLYREEGWPHPPEHTWATRSGSCRDFTLLFMDAARWMGLGARFASGYQEGDPDQDERHLHAWPEVFIPGAGWRGYDPTHGLAVADRHIVLATGATPQEAAPVSGTFRGTGVTAEMSARIHLEELSGQWQSQSGG